MQRKIVSICTQKVSTNMAQHGVMREFSVLIFLFTPILNSVLHCCFRVEGNVREFYGKYSGNFQPGHYLVFYRFSFSSYRVQQELL